MRFGKFELQSRIARGGTAEVFLAEMHGASGFKKRVALKLLLPEFASDPDFMAMFADEARLCADLSHPNIVQVFELGAIRGRDYIAMEYVRGLNLAVLRRGLAERKAGMPLGASATVLRSMLAALHFAHERTDDQGKPVGIVHRDVRPHNLLISDSGVVKVADFGIAKAAINHARTRTGVIKGCFAYLSPEQAKAKPVDRRSDVFAAGLVAYELFAGVRAYEDEDELEMLRRAQVGDLVPIAKAAPKLPVVLQEVVTKALQLDPAARWQTCRDFGEALQSALTTAGIQPYSESQMQAFIAEDVRHVELEPLEESSFGDEMPSNVRSEMADAKTHVTTEPKKRRPRPFPYVIGGALLLSAAIIAIAPWLRSAPPVAAPTSQPTVAAVDNDPDPPAPAGPARGFLTVNSRPWSSVYVDGALVSRSTPLRRHLLPIGKHSVTLQRGDGVKATFDVEISSGETTTKLYDWDSR